MNEATVRRIITPALAQHDLELDRLEIVRVGQRAVVRITVDGDGPEGRGPLLDDIADASRAVSDALDADPAVGERPYTLEVSTRGISRPLTDIKHFRRNRDRIVKFRLTSGEEVEGRVVGVDEAAHTVSVEPGRVIPLADVSRAVVQVEMNRPLLVEDGYFDDFEEN